jgi:hypothetical protein
MRRVTLRHESTVALQQVHPDGADYDFAEIDHLGRRADRRPAVRDSYNVAEIA